MKEERFEKIVEVEQDDFSGILMGIFVTAAFSYFVILSIDLPISTVGNIATIIAFTIIASVSATITIIDLFEYYSEDNRKVYWKKIK